MQTIRKQSVPWAMAAGRAALGPILIAGQESGWNGAVLALIVITALLSDIFDGILARRWSCDTPAVRLFDSMADTLFYLCVAAALWIGQPTVLTHYAALLIPLLALEAMRFGLDLAKFGKPASYHSYLAKAWGLVMAVGVVAVFWLQRANLILTVAMALGILCNLDGLAMSLMLPAWRKDVKTLSEAWRLRRQLLRLAAKPPGGLQRGRRRAAALARKMSMTVGAAVVLALSLLPPHAFAVESGQVAYIGGTAGLGQDRIGVFDTSSPATLVFKFKARDGSSGQIAIDYKRIHSFEYRNEVARHLGVLPAMFVGMVRQRQRKHFFTINYADSSNVSQVAIFEVAKHDQQAFLEMLRVRDPQICNTRSLSCGGSQGMKWN